MSLDPLIARMIEIQERLDEINLICELTWIRRLSGMAETNSTGARKRALKRYKKLKLVA